MNGEELDGPIQLGRSAEYLLLGSTPQSIKDIALQHYLKFCC